MYIHRKKSKKMLVNLFVVHKNTPTPSEGMVVLRWERKRGKGMFGLFKNSIVGLAHILESFIAVFCCCGFSKR